MRIIDSTKINPKSKNQRLFGVLCLMLGILSGCIQKTELEQAKEYSKASETMYQRAIKSYEDLITKGGDLDNLYLALGKLYYAHGDFEKAKDTLKKSSNSEAKKLQAISYYRLGQFMDALEVFDKYPITDDEYLYYHALTSERLNLFDPALKLYKEIKNDKFAILAKERMGLIEKEASAMHIKDLDPELNQTIAQAPSVEKYPQAGSLILSCEENIEITPQDTQVSNLHYVIKILNERGKESFAETQIEYDSTYEKIELEFARTIKPDGRIAEVGSRHVRDVSKYLNFPLYSNARVFIISFPEIVEGAVIEYKLKIYRSQLVDKKNFVLPYSVQAHEPIIHANFTLRAPKSKVINIKHLNEKYNNFSANLNPEIKEDADFKIYSWVFKDVPQILPESQMPPDTEINPALVISTFSSWQEIYQWWWNLAKDKIIADEAIKAKVQELTQGLVSLKDKAQAIYNFCAQKIRYVAVEYGQAGHEPHRAGDIFRNKYGDCKDQAILLVAMLREAGLNAYPVLIGTKEYYDLSEDLPSVLFNHCIATVELDGGLVFLDPTAETCSFGDLPEGDQDRKVLVFKDSGYQIQKIKAYPAGHNLVRQQLRIKFNSDESIAAQKTIYTYGMYDRAQRYWLLYTPPELIEETLKERIQDIAIGAKLDKYNIENLADLNKPVTLEYSFNGREYLTSAGSLRITPQLANIDTSVVAKQVRRYPIDFGALYIQEVIFEIEIPPGFSIKYMPQDVIADNSWLGLIVEYNHKAGKVSFRQKTELKKDKITQEEYSEFKKALEDLSKRVKQRIILEKKK